MTEDEQLERARAVYQRVQRAQIAWSEFIAREIELSARTSSFSTEAERAQAFKELDELRSEIAHADAELDDVIQELMKALADPSSDGTSV